MRYQVDAEAVLSATTAVQSSIARIQSEVAGLHSQLTSLQGSWTGQAADAFQGIIAEWHAVEQKVEESLSSINTALTHAGQQYAEIEAANSRLFAG